MNIFKITIKAHEIYFSDESWAFWISIIYNDVDLIEIRAGQKGFKMIKTGSIIFVVGKSPMDIMEPILCRKKVP